MLCVIDKADPSDAWLSVEREKRERRDIISSVFFKASFKALFNALLLVMSVEMTKRYKIEQFKELRNIGCNILWPMKPMKWKD